MKTPSFPPDPAEPHVANPHVATPRAGGQGKVTLKDVAAQAGVHFNTVSVVLNGGKSSARVSEVSRARILKAAEELGYRRNSQAANMKSGRSGWISLVMAKDVGASYPVENLIEGVSDELELRGLHLHLQMLPEEQIYEPSLWPRVLREWMSDGLIISYHKPEVPELESMLAQYRIPAIWTNARRAADCVFPDEEGAFYDATRRLIEMGHRRIMFLANIWGQQEVLSHYSVTDRRIGYERAMREARLQPRMMAHREWEFEMEKQMELLGVLREPASQRPTAFLSYSFVPIINVASSALQCGLRFPEDVTVIGAGGGNPVKVAGCMLTQMHIPFREVGRIAVRQLLSKIKDPTLRLAPVAVPYAPFTGDSHRVPSGTVS